MANIKSSKKRILTNAKARMNNKPKRSAMRNAIKKVEEAIVAQDFALAQENFKEASKRMDKAASAGIVHRNFVARQKSRLSLKVNSIAK